MDGLAHLTDVLVNMGFDIYDIERAYIGGYKTVESIIDFISGGGVPDSDVETSNRLRLRSAGRSGRTMFSTQPAYVNLSDLHWTNEGGSGNFDPVPVSLEGSVVESVHSGIDASGANERLDFEQRESRKLTETLRKEKLMERQVRERLLNEVAADKEARRKTHRSMPSSSSLNTTLTDIPRTTHGSSEPQNRIKIKLILFDRPNVPFVIDLDSSDSYADFLSSIQSLLLANPPERNVPATDVLQATDPALQALDRHLQSLSATDICVRLLVHTWPRRELSHPCASSSNPDPILTAQQLTKMQITNGTTIAVRHVNCPFQLRVMEKIDELSDLHPRIGQEFITPVDPHLEQPEPQPPVALAPREEDEDFPMEPIFVDDPHLNPCFPGQGQQLHPRPPGRALPTSALSVQENVRRAALNLAERLRPTSTESVPFDQGSESSSWTQVPTLVKICLNAIRTWVTQYAEAFSAARVGLINELDSRQPFSSRATASNQSDGAAIHRRRLEQWVAHHLSGMQWPDVLGQLLVQSLIDEKCFTARTAVLLRNCVSALDLRHYILTSTDLIQCLADRWTGLVSLHLDSDHPFQIATEGIYALKRLQNLTSLSLCGLHSVSDETLPYLLELKQLESLLLSETKISDSGWINSWAVEQSSPQCGQRRVVKLELNGMGSLLTDSGLKAIVQLFPRLQSLRIAQSHIRGITCDEPVSPPQNLAKLDVSGCTLMHSLPQTIVPPVLQKVPSDRYSLSGLRILLIGRCEQLDLSELLSQIEGHPICRLDGLITIPSLDGVLLQRVFSSGFPLSEVSLTGCNFDWFRGNPSILADFLCEWLPTDTLTQLSLPLRPVQSTQDADTRVRICTGLSRLGQCKKLVDLDLGGQIVGQQEFDSILNALQSLPHLNRLCVTDLPLGTQQALCNACPTHCKIRVHQHRRP